MKCTYVPERKRNTILAAVSFQYLYYEKSASNIHERMGKADFGAIDGAIAGCFDNSKKISVSWIEYYLAYRILNPVESVNGRRNFGRQECTLTTSRFDIAPSSTSANPVWKAERKCKGSEEQRNVIAESA
jgi:hypothetical protein